jgi:hypothetical protein
LHKNLFRLAGEEQAGPDKDLFLPVEFSWLSHSDRSINDAYCILCKSHLSIGSGAKNDLTRHAKSQNHMQLEIVQRKSKSMSLFVTMPNNSLMSNIEQFWGEMGKLDDIFSGTKRFGVLSKLAKLS